MAIQNRDLKKRLVWLSVAAICGTFLSLLLLYDIQLELITEHTRFREGFPSQTHWENPPYGRIKCFFFNFKNLESFLNGTDSKIEVEELGPASFIIGSKHTNVTHHPENSTITYRKVRYHSLTFDEEASAPGILNQTLNIPNYILLASAAKLQSKFFFVKSTFNLVSSDDNVFLKRTPYELLFNFTTPTLDKIARLDFTINRNSGFLVESMENRMEWFNVRIGPPPKENPKDFNHFFKINHINKKKMSAGNSEWSEHHDETCPISVVNASDCTLFPPYLQKDAKLAIATADSCRTMPLEFEREVEVKGYNTYRFGIKQDPADNCFRVSTDVPLPEGMFDVSKCHHDVPNAYSSPHYLNTKYNWTKHYTGFTPDYEKHHSALMIEPTTGIPLDGYIRYMSSIPMPKLSGFRTDIMKFSERMVPTFWYQFELLELNPFVKFNMTMGLVVMPILQPVLIGIFAFLTVFALVKFVIAGRGILEVIQSRSLLRQDNKTLEISLECEEQEFIKK